MFIILGIIVLLVLWIVFSYNSLIITVNKAKEAWSDIDVQLKRRYDLIPNLVNAVKGYATHESSAFEKVTEARARAMGAESPSEKGQAEEGLSGALKSIFAIAEAYPELKANQNFLSLQNDLSDTENKIQASRRYYNGNVRELNTAMEVFPKSIIAKLFNFSKMDFFQIDSQDQREPVKVSF